MHDAYRHFLVTDFDRLDAGLVGTRAQAEAKAADIARTHRGNAIHVLESVAVFESPDGAEVLRTDDLKDFPAR